MKIRSYSKIFAVGHPKVSEIFMDEIIAEEKVDGSQFSWCLIDNEVFCRSKGKDQTDATDKLFIEAVNYVNDIKHLLNPDWVYRGEVLNRPKHNAIEYGRVPKNNIIIFDIDTNGQTNYLSYEEKRLEAAHIGLETVPLLYRGYIKTIDKFMELLETESVLGKAKIEGVVIKNYKRWTEDGKTMMAKYVCEEFKELNKANWKKQNPNRKDVLEILAARYRNENRWEKAVQHLRENGELLHEPKDIAALFKEVNRDVIEECSDQIKEDLFKWAWKQLSRAITRGLPEWYKQKLAESAFPHTVPVSCACTDPDCKECNKTVILPLDKEKENE